MNGPQAKQPLVRVLTGPYGHPYHPILVTLPIGAWVASLIFDVASHLVSGPAFLAQGAVWLIALGVVGALLAASVGFLDFLTIPRGTPAFRTGLLHLSLNLAITVAFALNFLWRLGGYGHAASTGAGMIALSAVCLAALTVSGYLGGKLAYRYGVRVADEATQEEGYRAASRRPSVAG